MFSKYRNNVHYASKYEGNVDSYPKYRRRFTKALPSIEYCIKLPQYVNVHSFPDVNNNNRYENYHKNWNYRGKNPKRRYEEENSLEFTESIRTPNNEIYSTPPKKFYCANGPKTPPEPKSSRKPQEVFYNKRRLPKIPSFDDFDEIPTSSKKIRHDFSVSSSSPAESNYVEEIQEIVRSKEKKFSNRDEQITSSIIYKKRRIIKKPTNFDINSLLGNLSPISEASEIEIYSDINDDCSEASCDAEVRDFSNASSNSNKADFDVMEIQKLLSREQERAKDENKLLREIKRSNKKLRKSTLIEGIKEMVDMGVAITDEDRKRFKHLAFTNDANEPLKIKFKPKKKHKKLKKLSLDRYKLFLPIDTTPPPPPPGNPPKNCIQPIPKFSVFQELLPVDLTRQLKCLTISKSQQSS